MRLIDADVLLEKAWDANTSIGYVQVVDVGDVIDAPTISPDDARGVGCPVCQCKEPLPEDGMSHEYYIRGNTLYHYDTHFGWEGAEINYCPNCGAKMEASVDA